MPSGITPLRLRSDKSGQIPSQYNDIPSKARFSLRFGGIVFLRRKWMKVLLVTMAMGIGGAETHILELARGLKARGVEVCVASAGGVYTEELVREGIRHETLPLNQRRPLPMLTAERGLKRLIENEDFDIVHAHARIPAFLCGRLRRKMNFRFVTTDHLDFSLTPLLRMMTDWGEHTFAVSEDLRRYLLENFHVNPRHISLTVNGVDTSRFSPETDGSALRESFDPQGRAVILHISRLDEAVCLCAGALMDAMPRLDGRAMLVIVGDGDGYEKMQIHADAVNRTLGYRAVMLAGAQTDVRTYIAAADIVVAPSRAAMEGMASGKPTVISGSQGHGGIFSASIEKEAVASNLCFRGAGLPTAEILARELNTLLAMDETERQRLGNDCRAFIQRHFSVDKMVESQLSVYERLAAYRTGGDADVMLCGYYGYGNSGDEAILSVTVEELRRRIPDIRICVLSASPKETAAYYMVDSIHRFDLIGIRARMKRTRLFLFGGGSLLQDKTSTRSLTYYTELIRMARKNGVPVAVYANGVGPVTRTGNIGRVRETLAMAERITLRDRVSLGLCRAMALPAVPTLTFDPAILSETPTPRREDAYFVVIPKRLGALSRALTVAWMREIMQKNGWRPVIVSLFDAQDREYAEELARETGATCHSPQNAEDGISLLSGAKLVLSSRLHGLIYATVAAVPMIALSDDEKLFAYMERIGRPSFFCRAEDGENLMQSLATISLQYEEECNYLRGHLPLWRGEAEEELDILADMIRKKREMRET